MIEVINTLSGVTRELFMDLGRDPTPEELATEMNITPEKALMQKGQNPCPGPEARLDAGSRVVRGRCLGYGRW